MRSWKEILQKEVEKPYFQELRSFIRKERTIKKIYPPEKNVFRAFDYLSFDQIKVVILGQDPYHGENQAIGLAFGVHEDIPLPPSLINILTEVKNDVGLTQATLSDLSNWARQGVFLLNSVLTVEEGKPGSHSNKGWEIFTDYLIQEISKQRINVVFLLWGNYAKQRGVNIDRSKYLVLETTHPSPLSAHRGFFGCKHFSKTNEYLKTKNIKTINW